MTRIMMAAVCLHNFLSVARKIWCPWLLLHSVHPVIKIHFQLHFLRTN